MHAIKMEQTKVIIVEPIQEDEEVLQRLLPLSQAIICVDRPSNNQHIIERIRATQPDVVLMTLDSQATDNLANIYLIRQNFAELPILIRTNFEDIDLIFQSLGSGASGYLPKTAPIAILISALKEAKECGIGPISTRVSFKILEYFERIVDFQVLSSAETAVLELKAQGFNHHTIGDKLSFSMATINGCIKNICLKLRGSFSACDK